MTSGDLARATGETVRTVRFYEEEGLLRPGGTSDGGHRRYSRGDLEQFQLILDLRELGLSIPDIRGLLATRAGCRTAVDFKKLLADRLPAHIARARSRIERMRRLESELRQALASVEAGPSDSESPPCPCTVAAQQGAPRIVRVLARNGECGGRQHLKVATGPASVAQREAEGASRNLA